MNVEAILILNVVGQPQNSMMIPEITPAVAALIVIAKTQTANRTARW
jgi:hypothetical protein